LATGRDARRWGRRFRGGADGLATPTLGGPATPSIAVSAASSIWYSSTAGRHA
jgi:hypothetical protein